MNFLDYAWSLLHGIKKTTGTDDTSLLFVERIDGGLDSAINSANLTFDGIDIYPNIEEKAIAILYEIVAQHIFLDGNKRAGAAIAMMFLEQHGVVMYSREKTRALFVGTSLGIAEGFYPDKSMAVSKIFRLLKNEYIV